MTISSARTIFLAVTATALLSLTGGAIAKDAQGGGIVGSVKVEGHKTTCKEVTETQCTADGHGGVHDCHEVKATQCTIADIVHENPASPWGGRAAAAPGSLAGMRLSTPGSGPATPAIRLAAPVARLATLRRR